MKFGSLFLRFVAMMGLSVWIGGFMFYGGVVVPLTDAAFGHFEAGLITQKATDALNLIGAATLIAWWALVVLERDRGPRWVRIGRVLLLAATTAMLVALAVVHVAMDRHLATAGVTGFRPMHRVYLLISTTQISANVGLLAATLMLWEGPGEGRDRAPRVDSVRHL